MSVQTDVRLQERKKMQWWICWKKPKKCIPFLYHDCCLWQSLWTTKLFWKLTNTTDIQKCQMLNGQFLKQTWRKLLCVNKSNVAFIRKRSISVTPIKQPKLTEKNLPGCPLNEIKWDFQNLLTVPRCSDDPFVNLKHWPGRAVVLMPLLQSWSKSSISKYLISLTSVWAPSTCCYLYLLYLYIHTWRLKTLSQKLKNFIKKKKNKQRQTKIQIKNLSEHNEIHRNV